MMQVENESGILGSVRDYSPESTKLLNGPVPEKLVAALKKNPAPERSLRRAGGGNVHGLLPVELHQRSRAGRQAGFIPFQPT